MITSILIPTDFSSASWKATQFGMELARSNSEAQLSILHIYPSSSNNSGDEKQLEFQPEMDRIESRMNELAKNLLEQPEDKIKNVVLSGNVEETMLDFINDHKFDLVIIGVNSNGFDNKLGSHAIRVIEKSGTPVMIVPNTSE